MNSEFIVAIHALAYLDHRHTTVSSEELARSICTNPARIRKVMSALKTAGLLATKEGNHGGYGLHKKAEDILLSDVANALQLSSKSHSRRNKTLNQDCMIATGMGIVVDELSTSLYAQCIQYLSSITISDISKRLIDLHQKTIKGGNEHGIDNSK